MTEKMRILVIGGAGSGKSEYAEQLACKLGQGSGMIYLATMSAGDNESLCRIQKHRAQRAGKGFQTVERPCGLKALSFSQNVCVLLEDLSNLAANELFSQSLDSKYALQRMDEGIAHIEKSARHLVVVGNALFSDGISYDCATEEYLHTLAALQNRLAGRFEQVTEVVCGLPIIWKGENA